MAFVDEVRRMGFDLLGDVRIGGTSEVYRARPVAGGSDVALKVYHRGAERRAERELSIGGQVEDRCLALPYSGGELDDGRTYTLSRWVDGLSLRDVIATGGAMPAGQAVAIVCDIGRGLSALHREGVLHRDVTPSNVIVGDDHAVLIDVGHGRDDLGLEVTATGELSGTPRYVAPEVIRGGTPSVASDQYALALVTYELVAGDGPFPGGTSAATALHNQLYVEPDPLDERVPTVPWQVVTAVETALSKDPVDRWRSVDEFIGALLAQPRSRRAASRFSGKVRFAALVGGLALAAATVITFGGGRQPAATTDDVEDREQATVEIPAEIPSSLSAGFSAALACNLLAEADFESGGIGYNYFDNSVDPAADGAERVLPSGGVDGSGVLVVGAPGEYGRYAETVAVLPGQRYEFSASVLPVAPLDIASIGVFWLDEEFQLLESVGAEQSLVGAEPGRVRVVSAAAPPDARFAVPQFFKDGSDGLLLADELIFAEAETGCGS